MSLLAAFVAMLGKQWLNRYLRNSGGSMIERCGDRQRKCDGLEKWPLHFFVESLPVMLQLALLLLACALCRYMWFISTPVAYTLISLTGLGVTFYVAIIIAGMSSYACPFQTPGSTALRGLWKKVRRGIVSSVIHFNRVLSRTHRIWNQGVRSVLRRQSPPTTIRLENVQVHESKPWLEPKDLAIIRRTNASDAGCVSWILRNITDPEALDAALPLAGEVRWFDDGINVDPPYDQIVSTFEACFDSTRMLYPGSRDRAYYSGRAMMWIHTLALCKSGELASSFPLPGRGYATPVPDPDLEHLFGINETLSMPYDSRHLFFNPEDSPSHSQWISNILLHHSWADRTEQYMETLLWASKAEHTIPLNMRLDRLLMWCIFFGSPVEEEVLKVQDKSYGISYFCSSSFSLLFASDRMESIMHQLSRAVLSAINGTPTQRLSIPDMLRDLIKLETHPACLTEIAYEWCSVIYENRKSLGDWKNLLLICLKIGFRHFGFQDQRIKARIIHTKHHRGLVDVVFEGQESEAIADLLHAWTARHNFQGPSHELLGFCALHLVGLHNLVPFSPRLRRLVIRSVELIGCKGFKKVKVDLFTELLNHLHVTVEDMDDELKWATLLVDTIERTHRLSHWYWEFLVEFAVPGSWQLELDFAQGLQTIKSLIAAKEWSKLECWMGIVWMVSPPEDSAMAEGYLGRSMLLLFRQRPGAVQKLEQWMERRYRGWEFNIPQSFKQICKRAHEAAHQDAPCISFCAHQIFSESHAGCRFVLGRFHLPTKELKNSLIHHRPLLPHRPEAINSGSRWCIMLPNV